jgi:hypothetical protein
VVPQTQSRLLLGIGHRRKLNRWSSTGGVLEATVSDFKQKNGQFSAIISSVGRLEVIFISVATGVWAPNLFAKVGVNL